MTDASAALSPFQPQIAIELAAIAYDSGRQAITAQLQALPAALGGPWSLSWLATDHANQMLLAHSPSAGLALAIRGSVTDPSTLAFWLDWFQQDLNAFRQRPWVFGRLADGSAVSQGTLDGLNSLIGLSDQGLDIVSELARWRQSGPIAVIGHSLGGGLASAFAPWLEQAVSQKQGQSLRCVPLTFAAPAVGNPTFADSLEANYGSAGNRYHNTLDVVPHAWAGLDWIAHSFPGGPGIPLLAKGAVEAVREFLHLEGLRYRQPGPDQPLTGSITQGVSWAGEAGIQHGTATYRQLLKDRTGPAATDAS